MYDLKIFFNQPRKDHFLKNVKGELKGENRIGIVLKKKI